jgi:hypothetical protein
LSGDQLISTQLIPTQPSAHPRGENTWELIPRASWELGCAIGTMVSMFIVAGVFAIVVMESFLLLMQRVLCRLQASIITLVACHQAGIVALIVMTLLPSMRSHLCQCCDGNCYSCHNCVITVVDAQASPPLSS